MTRQAKKSDEELKLEVVRELKWDTHVNETHIGVEVDNSIVTLTGRSESYAERIAAQEAAHRVRGVLDVVNDINVKYTGMHTDTDIANAVRHALKWSVFVPDEHISSTVSGGIVTLEGEVDCWSQRDDAEQVVLGLTGVQDVINKIRVKVAVSASDVHRTIEDALNRRAARDARDIRLEVQDGKVILHGKVHSHAERKIVVGAVRGTRGVLDIDDRLELQPLH